MGILSNGGSHTINGGSGKKSIMKQKYKYICAAITLLLGVGFVICGILVLLFFRGFVDDYIKSEIPLRENTPIAEAWAKPPITPYLKLYFFNVTNPQGFLKGAKPVLQEIGPFTYQEAWEKVNVTWLENGKQVSYGQKKTYFFRKDLSVAGEETILTLPNLPMLTSLAAVKAVDESENIIKVALGSMLEILKQTPFVELTVSDILWGYENSLIQLAKGIFPEDKAYPFEKFGLFAGKNDTYPGILTTMTGQSSVEDVGRVVSWNGETKLNFWKDECNQIKGTDGSSFPPGILPNTTLYLFNRDLCRSLPLVYEADTVSQGVPGYRFVPPKDIFSPPEENPDNACYCMNEAGCKVPRGVFNMSACSFGSPVMISWPHFFQADPKLLEDVVGLKPEQSKHQLFMDIQPKLGIPLVAQARSQINIQMYKMDEVKPAEGLRDMIFPFMWFSSGIESIEDEDTLALLHTAVHAPEKARSALYPTFFVVGICMILIVSLFLGYHSFYKPVRSEPITPHKPKEENNGNSGHYEMRNGVVLATSG